MCTRFSWGVHTPIPAPCWTGFSAHLDQPMDSRRHSYWIWLECWKFFRPRCVLPELSYYGAKPLRGLTNTCECGPILVNREVWHKLGRVQTCNFHLKVFPPFILFLMKFLYFVFYYLVLWHLVVTMTINMSDLLNRLTYLGSFLFIFPTHIYCDCDDHRTKLSLTGWHYIELYRVGCQ